MSMEWEKAKAEQMIRYEVELQRKSQYPRDEFCTGLIQMAYALGLLTDTALGYWERSLEIAVSVRKQELINQRASA